jgi:signal transduction histidine kinase
MFYRLHNQGEYTGSGIGLAICQKVAIYHGGTISLASSSEIGSIFKVILSKHSQDINLVRD